MHKPHGKGSHHAPHPLDAKFRRTARRPQLLVAHARARHPRRPPSSFSPAPWRCTEPCFAPDFVLMLLAAGGLIALIYLLSLLRGVVLVDPGSIPGHPALL